MKTLRTMRPVPRRHKQLALSLLQRVRTRLSSPDHWNQGWFASTSHGSTCAAGNDQACSWCLLGALQLAQEEFRQKQVPLGILNSSMTLVNNSLINTLRCMYPDNEFPWSESPIPDFNDRPDTEHNDVLTLLDGAAEYLEESVEVDRTSNGAHCA